MGNTADPRSRSAFSVIDNCWAQLSVGIVGMVAIANLQYGWTFFVKPLLQRFPEWDERSIQICFTLFVLAETWLVPLEGYFVDRFGPRRPMIVGGLLVAADWLWKAIATSLPEFYAASLLGGAGAGIVYGASIGNALKWFSHRRGLAAGLTSAAFGAGSAVTVLPITSLIDRAGYQSAFYWFGIGQGGLVLLCALLLRAPAAHCLEPAHGSKILQSARDFTWQEMLHMPAFWLLYAMFVMVSVGGLMVAGNLARIAEDFGVAAVEVTIVGITLTALRFSAINERVLNGLTRPFFGWISDQIGRENTMFVAFALQGAAMLLFLEYSRDPVLFVLLTGLVFFAWGETYSLFPALCGDMFGRKFATTNYGLLYTGKGTASLCLPLLLQWRYTSGSWTPILLLFMGLAWMVALLALFVLKPIRKRDST